jgi:endonuclease/exonuclease/phosphatase family metal-dependent hydrolase
LVVAAAAGWWLSLPTSAGSAEGSAFVGTAAASAPAGRTLRIGTFNIDGGRGSDGLLDLNRTARSLQRLDFIGLNEVHADFFHPPHTQAEELAEKFRLPYLFAPAEQRLGRATFGNAVFTDLPVTRWQRISIPRFRHETPRNYVLTDVTFNGRAVHFLTTHVDWKPGGDEQRELILKIFLALPEPALLMGDLNAPQHDAQIERLLATPGVEEAITTILGPEPGRVDWIFLRGIKTLDAGRVDIGASDHPAYWAQVQLK